jgi:GNAT superfamily N-acetyltransferase
MAYEKHIVVEWVRASFGAAWASECEVGFANQPISCYVAAKHGELLGFACYDATARGLFGPIGVAETARRQGIGRALLLCTLHAMSALGYAYAIVGGAGDVGFYARTAGATEIPGSTPGIYRDRLKVPPA